MADFGSMHCWGLNNLGQTDVPTHKITGVLQISAKYAHTCAISYKNNFDGRVDINARTDNQNQNSVSDLKENERSIRYIFNKLFNRGNDNKLNKEST